MPQDDALYKMNRAPLYCFFAYPTRQVMLNENKYVNISPQEGGGGTQWTKIVKFVQFIQPKHSTNSDWENN